MQKDKLDRLPGDESIMPGTIKASAAQSGIHTTNAQANSLLFPCFAGDTTH